MLSKKIYSVLFHTLLFGPVVIMAAIAIAIDVQLGLAATALGLLGGLMVGSIMLFIWALSWLNDKKNEPYDD